MATPAEYKKPHLYERARPVAQSEMEGRSCVMNNLPGLSRKTDESPGFFEPALITFYVPRQHPLDTSTEKEQVRRADVAKRTSEAECRQMRS